MKIAVLKGRDLERFYHALGVEPPAEARSVRVWGDGDGLKVKVNEWTWSAPLGETEEAW
jgi:hypothetical protein